ncbi:MAG: metallophosphoesterase [Flavobacteriaceae bacterium]|nr:metallophosphoesterase [Flavobacteriaceae bacterium]
MNRRIFLKQSTAAGALMSLGGLALTSCNQPLEKHLTILHTNDVHSHIEPFPSSHPNYPNLGGIARRAGLIEKIRLENPNTLLLDAGDIFQGTPYFNFFGGEVEFKMMSKLKYDASTIGNHDFDNGIDGLNKQLPHAAFDFLIANYDFSNTILDGKTNPYRIFTKDGIKIGVFGLGVELSGLVDPRLYKETVYIDPVEIAQDMGKLLKEEKGCDLVICLSHLGYYYKRDKDKICDLNLAKQSQNIDLIIGGHTHTFLKKPTVTKNMLGENMLINQVGKWGINVGRIDFYFDAAKNISATGKSIIV